MADEITKNTKKKNWDPNRRYWQKPNKRGKIYAQERKNKVYMSGDNEGQELSEYDKGVRSGYLQCQSDHAGLFTYKTVANETEGSKTKKKQAAAKASRDKGYWKNRKNAGAENN